MTFAIACVDEPLITVNLPSAVLLGYQSRHADNASVERKNYTRQAKPEILRQPQVVRTVAVFQYLGGVIDAIIEQTDIDAVGLRVGELLDESVVVAKESSDVASGYGIIEAGKKMGPQ
jgi:hypothetical protein